MKPIRHKITPQAALVTILISVVANTIITFMLGPVGNITHFINNLIFSQCIGLPITISVTTVFHSSKTQRFQILWLAGAVLFGSSLGTFMASRLAEPTDLFNPHDPSHVISAWCLALLFGTIGTYIATSIHRIISSENVIKQERIQRLSSEKEIVETQLKLLQAQIEPHFLFNTLSNVLSLMETDDEKAAAMLTDLTRFLRSTLVRTRSTNATLGEEIEIIHAYLNVIKIRMGQRLTYRIDISEDLLPTPFAPLLLQPLVENAVRHGLEQLIDGGSIHVGARQMDEILQVWVSDTGAGIHQKNNSTNGNGVGLTNIRQRLKTLYGKEGCLVLEENQTVGLKAVIEVPIENQ